MDSDKIEKQKILFLRAGRKNWKKVEKKTHFFLKKKYLNAT